MSVAALIFIGLSCFPLIIVSEGIGSVSCGGSAPGVWPVAHDETDVFALQQSLVVNVVMGIVFTMDGHRLDITARAFTTDAYLFAVFKVKCDLVKIR